MNWYGNDTPLIIGHRGASADAPENTLRAFHVALEQGAAGFEFDVRQTADGHLILMHDSRLERTTDGTGHIHTKSLAELKALKVAGTEPIPTLDEVFTTFGDRVLYNIEIKEYSRRDRGVEKAIGRLIEQYDLAENCLVSSFSARSMQRGRAVIPVPTPMAMIRFSGLQQYSHLLFRGQADHPHHTLVTPRYMRWANQRGYRVHVWTVDDPQRAEQLLALGVHGLITNRPQFLRQSLGLTGRR